MSEPRWPLWAVALCIVGFCAFCWLMFWVNLAPVGGR